MAYRRKQGVPRPMTLKEEFGLRSPLPPDESSSSSSNSSLAAKAIRASSACRDSSLSSAYAQSALSPLRDPNLAPPSSPPSLPKCDNLSHSPESQRKPDNPALQKGLDAITSSLGYIGGTIGNALEEGLNIVENRTADIIQETRKLQIRKKGSSSSEKQNQTLNVGGTRQQTLMQTHMQPQMQTDQETQLKASRDVAMAMAAKAKLLLRELKTVKADLAFAKERCAQLEEENRIIRESLEKGDNPEDDDLIRLQLETLLAEKARLAQENSVFARENRFLREIVEYHQLTMQDVVYLDEGSEEVTEVYPIQVPPVSNMDSMGTIQNSTPSSPTVVLRARSPQVAQDVSPLHMLSQDLANIPEC
ncbi:hypothetical protein CsSME_00041340 [Camellia sinensis var. sinensis]